MRAKFVSLFLLFFALTGMSLAQQASPRVEPSFWWVGMKNPKLQLLVHGDKISEYAVSLSYPGIRLEKVNKVENPNYLFLDLDIGPATLPGKFSIHFNKKGAAKQRFLYELKARDKSANRIQGVTGKDLIYLIMPDRFSNGDPKNDRIKGMQDQSLNRDSIFHRHGGDLQGLINHLDYLKDLGVTAIWCTPEIENDQPSASYHGYAATDHYRIDPRFGTNGLYKQFVDQAHSRGIKVIKDIVHNHMGNQHYLIKDMPMKDWVHQWPAFTRTTYRDQTLMDPYAAASDRRLMLDGWFDYHMPDLNQNNPYVQKYLTQNNIWWIEYAGIDGLRLDTYPYNDPKFMADWAREIEAEFPSLSVFGETLASSINNAFYGQGNLINRGLDTHLPGLTDGALQAAIYEALNDKPGWNSGVMKMYNTLALDFQYKDPGQNVLFLDNHDMSRFFSVVGEDMNKFKSGFVLMLTTLRIPQMYYGDEILMKNFSNPDGLVRLDFPGGWPADKVNKFEKTGRTEKENEAFDFVRKLANYRKNNAVLQSGKLMQYVPENGVYVYFRYNADKTVMVAFNGNEKEAELKTSRFIERISGYSSLLDVISRETRQMAETLRIPAKTALVFELKK